MNISALNLLHLYWRFNLNFVEETKLIQFRPYTTKYKPHIYNTIPLINMRSIAAESPIQARVAYIKV